MSCHVRTSLILVLAVAACGGSAKPNSSVQRTPALRSSSSLDWLKPRTKFHAELVASTVAGLSVEGIVRDRATKQPMPGTMIVVTSSALQGARTAITDDGRFAFRDLPPGDYLLTAYNLYATTEGTFKVETGKLAKVTIDWDESERQGPGIRCC
jgi:hypothetical protein